MIINGEALAGIFRGFNTSFNKGFDGAESQWGDVAMLVPSSTRELTYAWLGQVPRMREWLGDRIIKSVEAYGYTIINRKFEDTIEVPREAIEDDQFGVYGPLIADMGRAAKEHPDELMFSMLGAGTSIPCYDGQYFFDAEHPAVDVHGAAITVSNIQTPADGIEPGPMWYVLDTSRAIKPFIYQQRVKPQFQHLDQDTQERVFMRDVYTYGVRARENVGFGLWQLAFASTAELNATNYAAARAYMSTLRGDEGRLLGIKATTVVIPPVLEPQGRQLLNSATIDATTNPWAGSAKLIVSPWLAT